MCAPSARHAGKGGGNPEDATGGPPEQRALSVHGMQEMEGGVLEQATGEGTPPIIMRSQRTACRNRGEGGRGIIQTKVEGGETPEQARTPFVRALMASP